MTTFLFALLSFCCCQRNTQKTAARFHWSTWSGHFQQVAFLLDATWLFFNLVLTADQGEGNQGGVASYTICPLKKPTHTPSGTVVNCTPKVRYAMPLTRRWSLNSGSDEVALAVQACAEHTHTLAVKRSAGSRCEQCLC